MPGKEPKKFLLRLDPDVYDAVKRLADAELRSVNGQIEYLLRQAVRNVSRKDAKEQREDKEEGEQQT